MDGFPEKIGFVSAYLVNHVGKFLLTAGRRKQKVDIIAEIAHIICFQSLLQSALHQSLLYRRQFYTAMTHDEGT
jgi:hypothetical protein